MAKFTFDSPARHTVARRAALVFGALVFALAGWSVHSFQFWESGVFHRGETGTIRYELDEAGRPVRIVDEGRFVDLHYDPNGNLVGRVEN